MKVGPGIAVPARVTVIAEDCAGVDVELEVVPEGGRLVAQEVRVSRREGGPPVTGDAIRSIPIATLTKHAAVHALTYKERDGYTEWSPRLLTPEIIEQVRDNGPDAASLEWVAYLYRVALLMGEPPTQAVAQALDLPRSTAGRWVAMARRRPELLGPSEGPGKASAGGAAAFSGEGTLTVGGSRLDEREVRGDDSGER